MDADRWRRIEELCHEAATRDGRERDAFLDEACGGDEALRQEVESLLAQQPKVEGFLATGARRPLALAPGSRLGPYEILELVGSGGMGEVYQARDTRLDRLVALKILPPHIGRDPEHRARFAREAKTISQLNHPHICTLYDVGEAELASAQRPTPSAQYLVMEYLEGETLAARLAKGPLSLEQALEVGAQIAEALAAAHKHGVVHRDLKPGNVMLTKSGAKLLDFGLAKLKAGFRLQAPGFGPEPSAAATESAPLTGRGVIVGTLPYMAPEQLEGKPVDERTDLWALGAILYEMLAGRRAFEGQSSAGLIGAILEREPEPLTARRPLTPRALDRLVRKCLAKDPEARWHSAADVAGELRWLARPGGRHWTRIAAVAAIVVAAIAALVWMALRLGAGSSVGAPLGLSAAPRPLTADPGIEKDPAISPDGNHVAFAWNGGDGRFHVYVVPVEGSGRYQLTHALADDARPTWSPAGNRIAFLRQGEHGLEVWWASFPAGEEKLVRRLEQIGEFSLGLDWSPDGRYLATQDFVPGAGRRAIVLLEPESGAVSQLTSPPPDASRGDSNPAFSPDGGEVAFLRGRLGAEFTICAQAVADGRAVGEPRQITPVRAPIIDFDWSPDGTELIYTMAGSPVLWRIPRSGGEPRELATAQDAQSLALDRGGRRLVYATYRANTDIWRMPGPEAGVMAAPARFIHSTRNDGQPRYSADGSLIAFVSDRTGEPNIWVADSDGNNQQLITRDEWAIMPQWSPKENVLAYDSRPRSEIYRTGLNDTHPMALTQNGLTKGTPIWSPDARWIYYSCQPDGPERSTPGWHICKVPSHGGDTSLVATGQTPLGVDDRYVYFHGASEEIGLGGIYRVAHEGGERELVLDRSLYSWEWTVWRGTLVYVDRFQTHGPALWTLDLAGGQPVRLASLDPRSFPHLLDPHLNDFVFGGVTVSPDGQWILYGRQEISDADLMVIDASPDGAG